jgi:hypothetical protein
MMLSFFKKSLSVDEAAKYIFNSIINWPAQHGESLSKNFEGTFNRSMEIVFDEIIYFLSFSIDYAIYIILGNNSIIRDTLRDAFAFLMREFAIEHKCKQMPEGEWGSGLVWLNSDLSTNVIGNPLANLSNRIKLYQEALKRTPSNENPIQSLSYLLAALCGTLDISFNMFASEVCLGEFEIIKTLNKDFNIKV